MPELPEVETMVRGIRPHVEGRRIEKMASCRTRCRPISITPRLTTLSKRIEGLVVNAVRRLGKRVVFDLEGESHLAIEPRMTGLVLLADPPDPEHLRVEWRFEGSRPFNSVWFWDRRGLGTIQLFSPGQLDQHFGPKRLGPDALTMTDDEWHQRLNATRRAIKVALLDQKLVAGIGNLYASEILHVSAIHPETPADSLTKPARQRLLAAARSVLILAIEYEGSTLGDGTYRNALNQSGRYQNEHRVYMREGESCLNCQQAGRTPSKIIRIVQAQRSTFYCPQCQKKPRG